MRTLVLLSLTIFTQIQGCIDPAPAPPPVNGAASVKGEDDEAPKAASPHAGDLSKKGASQAASNPAVKGPSAVAPAPAPAPWVTTPTVASTQPGAIGSQTNAQNSLLTALLSAGAGALGGASLGSYLGDLIGNQELGSLLGSLAGAGLGGALSQSSQSGP